MNVIIYLIITLASLANIYLLGSAANIYTATISIAAMAGMINETRKYDVWPILKTAKKQ